MNPLEFEITDIELIKFNNTERMSLMAQFFEFNVYQSLHQPCIKADLLIFDPIGLLINFPLLGEETIEVTFKHTRPDYANDPNAGGESIRANNQRQKWTFMVNTVRGMNPDEKWKAQVYVIELYSLEMRENARRKIQKAYREPYHSAAKKVLLEDLKVDPVKVNDELFEESQGVQHVVIPNFHPMETVKWFAKRAVPVDLKHKLYFFYENFRGYNFQTIEKMIERGNPDNVTIPEFVWMPDMNTAAKTVFLRRRNLSENSVITALEIHRRFNTIEKLLGGYYESDFVDIDTFNRIVVTSPYVLDPNNTDQNQNRFAMNTDEFILAMQTQGATKARTRYILSQDEGDEAGNPNFWKSKWGWAAHVLTAWSQVSLTISVPGDSRINAGDVIKLGVPELTGFTDSQSTVDGDRYLTGLFVVVDIKHKVTVGMNYIMTLNLHRGSYETAILEQSLLNRQG